MKDDMQTATTRLAITWYIDPAPVTHAVPGGNELPLVELNDIAGQRSCIMGLQGAIDPLQKGARSIISTIVDKGIAARGTSITKEVSRHRMLCIKVVLIGDIRGRYIISVVSAEVVHDP